MKNISNFKLFITKRLQDSELKNASQFKEIITPEYYKLLCEFYKLKSNQQQYIMKTIHNIKKYKL